MFRRAVVQSLTSYHVTARRNNQDRALAADSG
jgi:hypothetical protein